MRTEAKVAHAYACYEARLRHYELMFKANFAHIYIYVVHAFVSKMDTYFSKADIEVPSIPKNPLSKIDCVLVIVECSPSSLGQQISNLLVPFFMVFT
jgi:hypothetical protein